MLIEGYMEKNECHLGEINTTAEQQDLISRSHQHNKTSSWEDDISPYKK